ncbi:MAG: tRNA pseudouridine(55) synthase TruB [Treponema sp.]|jgi:tRNA pseudouridine55 synthase|nr:tRNA pseudouridine(55) synthase TruB [Treponema sp.]
MRNSEISGYLLYHKKSGVTSFGALNAVKKALSTDKVGHTGTLDKFASGLLLVLVGKALKLAPLFADCDKQYDGVVKFGEETDTLDPEGAVIAEAPVPSLEALESAFPQFRGAIMQEPPVYSAVHVGGRRASALVRKGETVALQKRPVSIYRLELVSYTPPFAEIKAHCSKGAYIRSLARDIARAAGSRARLASLNRTHIAGFRLEDAIGENELSDAATHPDVHDIHREENIKPGATIHRSPISAIHPVDKRMFALLNMPCRTVDGQTARAMIHGKNLAPLMRDEFGEFAESIDGPLGVFCEENSVEQFIGFVEKKEKTWKYGYVYAGA